MQVALRQATFADALRVATLLIETRLQCMPYAPCAYSDDEVRAWVASELVPSAGVTVAEHDGQVIGVVATAREAQASWITQMAVDPATLGRGIGSALLAHVMHRWHHIYPGPAYQLSSWYKPPITYPFSQGGVWIHYLLLRQSLLL